MGTLLHFMLSRTEGIFWIRPESLKPAGDCIPTPQTGFLSLNYSGGVRHHHSVLLPWRGCLIPDVLLSPQPQQKLAFSSYQWWIPPPQAPWFPLKHCCRRWWRHLHHLLLSMMTRKTVSELSVLVVIFLWRTSCVWLTSATPYRGPSAWCKKSCLAGSWCFQDAFFCDPVLLNDLCSLSTKRSVFWSLLLCFFSHSFIVHFPSCPLFYPLFSSHNFHYSTIDKSSAFHLQW